MVNNKGEIFTDYIYKKIDGYDPVTDLIPAQKDDLYGYINSKGKVIIPFQYEVASEFKDGKAEVAKNYMHKHYFINKEGKCIQDCY